MGQEAGDSLGCLGSVLMEDIPDTDWKSECVTTKSEQMRFERSHKPRLSRQLWASTEVRDGQQCL